MKTVGRGRVRADAVADQGTLARTAALLRGTPALAPRGLYRFHSFEEADQWMNRMLARTHVRLSPRTSPASASR